MLSRIAPTNGLCFQAFAESPEFSFLPYALTDSNPLSKVPVVFPTTSCLFRTLTGMWPREPHRGSRPTRPTKHRVSETGLDPESWSEIVMQFSYFVAPHPERGYSFVECLRKTDSCQPASASARPTSGNIATRQTLFLVSKDTLRLRGLCCPSGLTTLHVPAVGMVVLSLSRDSRGRSIAHHLLCRNLRSHVGHTDHDSRFQGIAHATADSKRR